MAFNPNSFIPQEQRSFPVILLLDVSGSMRGSKIASLHAAVVEMVNTFVQEKVRENCLKLAMITFGAEVKLQAPSTDDVPYIDVAEVQNKGIPMFHASGGTPLGAALKKAKAMLEDKAVTPGRWYAPAVVLVSDGRPGDSWKKTLNDFISNGRSLRCQRIAVPIGNDADLNVLKMFASDESMVFFAEDANQIADAFRQVTMSVTSRASQSNPDAGMPKVSQYHAATSPSISMPNSIRPTTPRTSVVKPVSRTSITYRSNTVPPPPFEDDDDF